MNLLNELDELLSLERWAARLPQAVADCDNSATTMAKIGARKYNKMFELYPVTVVTEINARVNMNPRLVRK